MCQWKALNHGLRRLTVGQDLLEGLDRPLQSMGTLVARYRSERVAQHMPYDYAAYDGYGNQLIASLGIDNGPKEFRNDPGYDPVGFCGQWGCYTDVETGLILMGHRYHNPVTGRFMTRDPIGYEGGINLYAYCGNNPLTGTDPTGLAPPGRLKRFMDWLERYIEAKAISDAAGLSNDPNFGVSAPIGEDGRPLHTSEPIHLSEHDKDIKDWGPKSKFPHYRPNPTGGGEYTLLRPGKNGRWNAAVKFDGDGFAQYRIDFSSSSGRRDHPFPHWHQYTWEPGDRHPKGNPTIGKEHIPGLPHY